VLQPLQQQQQLLQGEPSGWASHRTQGGVATAAGIGAEPSNLHGAPVGVGGSGATTPRSSAPRRADSSCSPAASQQQQQQQQQDPQQQQQQQQPGTGVLAPHIFVVGGRRRSATHPDMPALALAAAGLGLGSGGGDGSVHNSAATHSPLPHGHGHGHGHGQAALGALSQCQPQQAEQQGLRSSTGDGRNAPAASSHGHAVGDEACLPQGSQAEAAAGDVAQAGAAVSAHLPLPLPLPAGEARCTRAGVARPAAIPLGSVQLQARRADDVMCSLADGVDASPPCR
jgi:hypothetical protein